MNDLSQSLQVRTAMRCNDATQARAPKAEARDGPVRRAATGGCELRTRNQGLLLAKYRGAPPRTRLRPGRTRSFNDLAEASARQRRFCSSSRPTDITSKRQLKVSESKTARSRGWRGCEPQSSRIAHLKPCDGHCQAFWRGTSSAAGVGSLSPRSDVSGVFP